MTPTRKAHHFMRLRRIVVLFMFVAVMIASGCATRGTGHSSGARLLAADVDRLAGDPWVGTLTYLDYTSNQLTTIDSSLMVRRTDASAATWEFGVGYSKEPHADSKEVVSLSGDGTMLGDEVVVSREETADGGLRFVTECDGMDDERPARFRFEHTVTAKEYVRRKMVRFNGEEDFFERHVYRWGR